MPAVTDIHAWYTLFFQKQPVIVGFKKDVLVPRITADPNAGKSVSSFIKYDTDVGFFREIKGQAHRSQLKNSVEKNFFKTVPYMQV
jgi:hypothetical protein